MFSRFISEARINEIRKDYLCIDKEEADVRQTRYPPIGRKPAEEESRIARPTLDADRTSIDIQIDIDNPEIQFNSLCPEYAKSAMEYGSGFFLANAVRLHDQSNTGQTATVYPSTRGASTFLRFGLGERQLLSTTEGFVFFPEYRDFSERWNLLDGTTAFNEWFKANQVPAIRSDAGKATEQIIDTLGGLRDVSCLAHKGVIEFLNKLTGRLTKTSQCSEFQSEICNAIDNEKLKDRTFETLVEQKAVELGLELKCSKCSKWSWYSVDQLDYTLICNFCFKQFNFPIIDPVDKKHSTWAYRVVGPFALPKYADGGYAAALAIHFFANIMGGFDRAESTWSSGQELTLNTNKKVEADFMLWYRRKDIFGTEQSFFGTDLPTFGMNRSTETVFGEAKSFRRFEQKHVNDMKLLAEKFPGSILVFAAMKEGLSPSEINRIKRLAEWGREYDPERRQTRAPVMVLTGTELFTPMSLEDSWEEKGGKHKDLIQVWGGNNNLRVLADLTQQLYLGMPSYE